jgi:hypothetical protein
MAADNRRRVDVNDQNLDKTIYDKKTSTNPHPTLTVAVDIFLPFLALGHEGETHAHSICRQPASLLPQKAPKPLPFNVANSRDRLHS